MSKRKQPDEDEDQIEPLPKLNSFVPEQIENEYEHLDDDVDEEGAICTEPSEQEDLLKAQMPTTIIQDGDIKVTPFNLTEELEEGEFDKAGNFVFTKKEGGSDTEGGDDTWADSIDWDEVAKKERQGNLAKKSNESMDSEPTVIDRDQLTCYKEMLRIMRPDENVQKTIKRLGNLIPRRRPFNKNTRRVEQSKPLDTNKSDELEVVKRKLDFMIELADQRFREGDLDIYEKTYEDLEEAIN